MKFTVAAAQYPITFHSSWKNWEDHTEKWIGEAANQGAALCLFPEYGSMELVSLLTADARNHLQLQVRELAGKTDEILHCFARLSKKYKIITVAPSLPVTVGPRTLNRVHVFSPDGELVGFQDKFFMTRFENENWKISQPEDLELTVFHYQQLVFGIQICYDVEFPLGSTILAQQGAKLILAPSCTETRRGSTRVHTGAKARAQELQCYTLIAQTIGEAAWSLAVDENYGQSALYGPADFDFPEDGVIKASTPQIESWLINEVDFSLVEKVRKQGQVFNFQDTLRQKLTFESPIKTKSVYF